MISRLNFSRFCRIQASWKNRVFRGSLAGVLAVPSVAEPFQLHQTLPVKSSCLLVCSQPASILIGTETGRCLAHAIPAGKSIWQRNNFPAAVSALALSSDGRQLAVGCWDGSLHLLSPASRKILHSWKAHEEAILCLQFAPNTNQLASGSCDDKARIWDLPTAKLRFELEQDNEYDVTALRYAPDGTCLVYGDGDNRITMSDTRTGAELMTLNGHRGTISDLTWSLDNSRIYSTSWDQSVRGWNAATGQALSVWHQHRKEVRALALSRSGATLFTGGDDGQIIGWQLPEGKPRMTIQRPDAIHQLAEGPAGKHLIVSRSSCIEIWKKKADR